jgi:hypothetical protein
MHRKRFSTAKDPGPLELPIGKIEPLNTFLKNPACVAQPPIDISVPP